ncbi:hypothetical protein ACUIJN_22755 [Metabacillus halosaccharovorans]
MKDIKEMLRVSEIRTDILTIAFWLIDDPKYSKEDAAEALVKFLEKHEL